MITAGERIGGKITIKDLNFPDLAQDGMRRDNEGLNSGNQADMAGVFNLNGTRRTNKEGNNAVKTHDGPGVEELDGLDMDERKRKRIGLDNKMQAEKCNMGHNNGSGLSHVDCTEPQTSYLAELAMQASQSKC